MYTFEKPEIQEYYSIVYSDKKIFFRSPERFVVIEGNSVELLKKVMKYLNGKFTVRGIVSKTKLSEIIVKKILKLLAEKNLLYKTSPTIYKKGSNLKETSSFFSRIMNGEKLLDKMESTSLTLINANPLACHLIISLSHLNLRKIKLVDNQLVTPHDIEQSPYGIYTNDDLGAPRIKALKRRLHFKNFTAEVLPQDLQERTLDKVIRDCNMVILCSEELSTTSHNLVDKVCHKLNKPWMNVRLLGDTGEVGPIVSPFKTPCFTCYENRIKSNSSYENYYYDNLFKDVNEKWGTLREFYSITANYATLEIVKFFSDYFKMSGVSTVISIDFMNNKTETDTVLRVPNCATCG